jgi:hypothetical protein
MNPSQPGSDIVGGVWLALLLTAMVAAPAITSLKPVAGTAGTTVQVIGGGFLPTAGYMGGGDPGGNTVRIGPDIALKNLNSADGVTVQFQIPRDLKPATYRLSIVNANGASNEVELTVRAPSAPHR